MTSPEAITLPTSAQKLCRRWRICHHAEQAGQRWDRARKADPAELAAAGRWLTIWTRALANELEHEAPLQPFCACGRVVSQCDGSRQGCRPQRLTTKRGIVRMKWADGSTHTDGICAVDIVEAAQCNWAGAAVEHVADMVSAASDDDWDKCIEQCEAITGK